MAARSEAKIKFIAETTEFNEQIKRANQSFAELRSELKLSEAQFKGNEQSVQALTDKKRILQQQLEASGNKVESLRQKLEKAKNIYGENSTEVSKLKTQLNNAQRQYVETENAIDGVNRELNEQEQETEQATTAMHGLDSAMEKCSGGFTVFKGVVADLVADGIRLLVDGLKEAATYAIRTGMDFEAGMSQVKATSGATAEEMTLLTAEAMRVGESTKFSASEAAEGLNYMAMAGWKADDMLAGLEGMANLAAAANTDLGTASDIVTDTLTAMGYAAGDSARLADVMAAASANANTNVELMGYTFKYAAPVAGALGYSMEDLAVATGLMANAGIKGEQAGTTLRAGLTNLVKPAKQASDAMEKYGINIKNSDGTVKPFAETMVHLRDKLGELPEAEQAAAAAAIFGKEAMSGWLAVINTSDEEFMKLGKAIYGSEGAAKQMAATMQDNLKGDIEELGGALDTLSINISSKFNGAMREGVQAIKEFVTGNASVSETFSRLSGAAGQAIEVIRGYLPQMGKMGTELISNLAQGLASGLPNLVTGAANIVVSIGNGLANNMPKILQFGGQLIMGLGQSIVTAAPKLITSAANIVKSLAEGVKNNAPGFVSKALDLLDGFADSLTKSVPKLVTNGMQFIRSLVQGIVQSLPELISRVPEIVSKFANIINDNAPTIIKAGIGIIKDLVVGIIKAIPTLVQNIPKIITAIIDVWEAFNWASLGKKAITLLKDGIIKAAGLVKTAGQNILTTITNVLKNLPTQLMNLGKSAITKLANGIRSLAGSVRSSATNIFNVIINAIKGLPAKLLALGKQAIQKLVSGIKSLASSVKSAATDIGNKIIDTLKQLPSKVLDVGKNIVKGLWEGISNAGGWLLNKIKEWAGGILDGIKGFFGIKSPSRVMRDEVGRYLAEGVGEGIAKNEDAAISPMQGIVKKLKGIDVASEWSKLSGVGGSLNYDVSAQLGDYVSSAIDSNSPYALLASLIDAVEDLANRPIDLSIDGHRFATATAGASDNVSGNRFNLKSRGLAL